MPDEQFPNHDLIVIGGSAGSIDALDPLLDGLPANLPAAVCIVIHRAPYLPFELPRLLSARTPLVVRPAEHGAPLETGTIYVGVPNQHLLIEAAGSWPTGRGVIRLTRGPRENRTRPAIDPLFRSAALAFGPRVIAVVLSGALDDGTAGLWAVRDRGGIAVVQDPSDALVDSMPASALGEVGADYVAPAAELGSLLGKLASMPARVTAPPEVGESLAELQREVEMAKLDEETHDARERYGVPSRFSCPDCGGVLWNVGNGHGPLRLRCSTGHAYSPATLAEVQTESLEDGLWGAVRALEEKAELARVRAEDAQKRGLPTLAARYTAQEEVSQAQAAAVRAVLRADGRTGMQRQNPPKELADVERD